MAAIRAGRATPALVERIRVEYYGIPTPLNQIASISAPEARLLIIQPWDIKALASIEKSILKSDLGLTPVNRGDVIWLTIPPLTEERRKELVKVAHEVAEEARNEIRQIRREGNDSIKDLEKNKEISEDQMHDGQEQVQKLTDNYVGKVNDILEKKEEEIMEV